MPMRKPGSSGAEMPHRPQAFLEDRVGQPGDVTEGAQASGG